MLAREQVVNFVKIKRIETPTIDWKQFEYRPELGWRWLQKLAFAILRWIGAHHMPIAVTFRRTAEGNDDLLKSLLGQEGQWIAHVHDDREQMRIYMGPDEERSLIRLSHHMDMQAVTFTGWIETSDRYGMKWHGIPITVVPWMKGAIIVPWLNHNKTGF